MSNFINCFSTPISFFFPFFKRSLYHDTSLFPKQSIISQSFLYNCSFFIFSIQTSQFIHTTGSVLLPAIARLFSWETTFSVILVSSITTACSFATKSVKSVSHHQSWCLHLCYGELPFWRQTKNRNSLLIGTAIIWAFDYFQKWKFGSE